MVLWIFAYGSLMWSPGFHYDQKLVGYVKNYKRVFYQGNTDHRGTPENPGRTVTLLPYDGAICWGIAYCISDRDREQLVLSYLELREKEYDVRDYIDFYTESSPDVPSIHRMLVYIASSDSANKNYLGPAPLEDMACQIAKAVGPSGPNAEYLLRLQDTLIELGCHDDDIENLVHRVYKVIQHEKGCPMLNRVAKSTVVTIRGSIGPIERAS
eukprot:c22285_g1_i1 orf=264-899(+)